MTLLRFVQREVTYTGGLYKLTSSPSLGGGSSCTARSPTSTPTWEVVRSAHSEFSYIHSGNQDVVRIPPLRLTLQFSRRLRRHDGPFRPLKPFNVHNRVCRSCPYKSGLTNSVNWTLAHKRCCGFAVTCHVTRRVSCCTNTPRSSIGCRFHTVNLNRIHIVHGILIT